MPPEDAGYDVLVIDSFSMEWVGPGGVLDWQAEEHKRMGGSEKVKLASWIVPKMAHKKMVYSFLQRKMPIVFCLRAEQTTDGSKDDNGKVRSFWKPLQNKAFPFELTVSFMLGGERKGIVDLSLPFKMEGAHRDIFRDGDLISEEHGARLAINGRAARASRSRLPTASLRPGCACASRPPTTRLPSSRSSTARSCRRGAPA